MTNDSEIKNQDDVNREERTLHLIVPLWYVLNLETVKIAGEKETQSLTWKKLPQCEGEKSHEKTDILCVVQVQNTSEHICIGKGGRDRVIYYYQHHLNVFKCKLN